MKNTPTNEDPRDLEIASLRAQLRALAPRDQEERARFERRLVIDRKEQLEARWRAMSTDQLLAEFQTLNGGDHRQFMQVVQSFCGGVLALCRAANPETRGLILSACSIVQRSELEIDLYEDLPEYVRVSPGVSGVTWDSRGEPSPRYWSATTEDFEVDDATSIRLSALGIATAIRGRNLQHFVLGWNIGTQPYVEMTLEAWTARLGADAQLRAYVAAKKVVARALTDEETRIKLKIERIRTH